ncbi:MAG: DNA recombination protein RmuC [Candidatus Tagabacteria bacterium CG_4_9_14_0_2_um_filter_41_11]|uniref:DNA recombination protein RmuC n=2 Tax=Candidatus Tagaibacteriota TaxID=1817918 RepID=A0A2M7B9N4_9BACT|nr:MAG: DNA recombination protein RmuC [Candidatus Tagabacteria bacterium CG03_land_8_20_14_0_80_41_22]PJC25232.1 MAG: DNA recombination protein RmuC [Candidatus Tagabacteria bacterium CG_4_9_14_0_2_um_filter_41_11]
MSQLIYIILAILGGMVVGLLPFFFIRFLGQRKKGEGEDKAMLMLQEQLKEIRGTLDMKLGESNRAMQEQSGHTTRLIKEITQELVKVGEGQKQVVGFADQLQGLQDILKNPKQRGVLGEYYLESVLKNVLPPKSYQMQYKFKDGEIVDAVVFVKDKIIPIDSKFSLENYNRILGERDPLEKEKLEKAFKADLKNRIDETSKYIRPSEDTMDFAFMFIPAEAIYYDLLVNQVGAIKTNTKDMIEYAFKERRVIIVSPTSFLAYLQTVLQGLRALQIEESAKKIRKKVEDLGRHLMSYEQFLKKLGNNLGTVVNSYNSSYKEFQKIDKDVLRITGEGIDSEPLAIDKPEEI